MRNCALWISPHAHQDEQRIVDTAAMDEDDRALFRHDPDTPPADTVLVVVHPARYRYLIECLRGTSKALPFAPNARSVATWLVEHRFRQDPELRRRLRW